MISYLTNKLRVYNRAPRNSPCTGFMKSNNTFAEIPKNNCPDILIKLLDHHPLRNWKVRPWLKPLNYIITAKIQWSLEQIHFNDRLEKTWLKHHLASDQCKKVWGNPVNMAGVHLGPHFMDRENPKYRLGRLKAPGLLNQPPVVKHIRMLFMAKTTLLSLWLHAIMQMAMTINRHQGFLKLLNCSNSFVCVCEL